MKIIPSFNTIKINFSSITKNQLIIILSFFTLFLLIINLVKAVKNSSNNKSSANIAEASLSGPINLNKTFIFKTSSSGNTPFKYTIMNASLQNQAVVAGQVVSAIQGKTFLIINLKLNNGSMTPLSINTKDYIRLIIGTDKSDLLAADFHSDPVVVQPISAKLTRLGFVVPSNIKTYQLKIGELEGNKKDVDIHFK